VTATHPPDPLVRHRLVMATPATWPVWPFLPVVRRCRGTEELGVLFDALHACGLPCFSSTAFLTCLFTLPPARDQFLSLPREVFDSVEVVIAAGWRVD
jgi:hypothetical protein